MPKLGMEEIRKEQIINATKDRIVKKGLANLSLKDIAKEAGVSTGVIYHYFENKEDILLQVLREAFKKSHLKVMETVESAPSPSEKLTRHLEQISASARDNPEFYLILMDYLGVANHDENIRKIIGKFFRNLTSYIKGYMGDEGNEVPDNFPVMVYSLGMGLSIMRMIDPALYDIDAAESDMKKMIFGFIEN